MSDGQIRERLAARLAAAEEGRARYLPVKLAGASVFAASLLSILPFAWWASSPSFPFHPGPIELLLLLVLVPSALVVVGACLAVVCEKKYAKQKIQKDMFARALGDVDHGKYCALPWGDALQAPNGLPARFSNLTPLESGSAYWRHMAQALKKAPALLPVWRAWLESGLPVRRSEIDMLEKTIEAVVTAQRWDEEMEGIHSVERQSAARARALDALQDVEELLQGPSQGPVNP